MCENFGNSGGELKRGRGGKFWGPVLENPEGREGHTANPFRGGGMHIFWEPHNVIGHYTINSPKTFFSCSRFSEVKITQSTHHSIGTKAFFYFR